MNIKLLVALLSISASLAHGAKCTYSLSPTSASCASSAATGSFSVSSGTGCAWAATTTNAWIHTTSTGAANGNVDYTVDPNLLTTSRTGAIVVEGTTFLISQAGAPLSLGLLLNNNLVWITGSDYPWTGTTSPTYDGVYAAASGNRFVPDSVSYLETTVTGPGIISFWWKVDSDVTPPPPEPDPYSWDELNFSIDDEPQDMIRGQIDWNYRSFAIPEGEHVVRWSYVKDSQYNLGQDRGWLDQVSYTTNPPVSLGSALDVCGAQWWTGGNLNPTVWAGETEVTHDGQAAARSGAITTSQESTMQTTVCGVTNLSFWWKVSSETNYDGLEFYTNGVLLTRITGEVDWRSNFFKLAPGTNTLTWRYVKNYADMGPKGSDCAWVDQVVFYPPLKPAIAAYATNLVLSSSATDCQVPIPDLTGPDYFTLGEGCASVTVTQSPAAGTILSPGANTVIITATSPLGTFNTVTGSVFVVDLAPPVITLLGGNPLTNEVDQLFVDPGATAVDECSSELLLTTNNSLDISRLGAYAVQYIATDSSGNSATNTRWVYVVDTQAPQLVQPVPSQTLAADANCSALMPNLASLVQATDNYSVSLAIVQTPAAGALLPLGLASVSLAIDDGNGNTNFASTTITVEDRNPPVITLLGASPMTNECHEAFSDPGISASDTCGAVEATTNSSLDTSHLGSYAIQYVATDSSGNSATNTRWVYVVDTQAPQLVQPVPAQTLAADANCSAPMPNLTGLVQATDNYSVALTIVQIPAAGTLLPVGLTNISFAIDDGNGNTNFAGTTLTVEDHNLPTILTQPLTRTNETGTEATFMVSASACSALSYQWLLEGTPLPGQTFASLTIPVVASTDVGSYSVALTSSGGCVTSAPAILVVQNPEPPSPATVTGLQRLADGSFQFSFSGQNGRSYSILASPDLSLPINDWTTIDSGTFSETPVTFVDTSATNFPQRFYRILSQ